MKKIKIVLVIVLFLLVFLILTGCGEGYKVTFNSQGGSSVKSQTIGEEAGQATEPDAPTRKGYTFGGWYISKECNDGEKFNFNTVITKNLTLYAKWIEGFTVTFDSQGGSDVAIQKIEKGEKITKPNPPQKAGFIFAGWWTDQDCTEGNEYDFEKPVNADVTIYAKWLAAATITFNSQGGSDIATQKIEKGEKPAKPDDPEKAGFVFAGWWTDQNCTENEYDFEKPVNANITLYAKWIEEFTVTFNSQGGSDIAAQKIEKGKKIAEPNPPQKTGYVFEGWWTDQNCTENEYDFEKPVNANITLYAKWREAVKFTVAFNSQGGSDVSSQIVIEGDKATEPKPKREGYTFAGWWTDQNCTEGNRYDFNSLVNSDFTLYAKWKEKVIVVQSFTVTFNSQGGNVVSSQTVTKGDGAYQPGVPAKSGFVFGGWFTDKNCSAGKEYSFGTPVNASVTLYAKWLEAATVTFNSQGGSNVPVQAIEKGKKAAQPAPPAKAGFMFAGWWIDQDCTEGSEYDFNTAVNASVTLYAKWLAETNASSFEFELTDDESGYIVIEFVGDETEVIIPLSYNGKPVKGIGVEAFFYSESLTSIIIQNGVISIGDGAFEGCSNLTSVTIGNSVTSVGWGAFYGCSSLISIIIPDGVTSIGGAAFDGCSNLTSVTIGNSVTSIGEGAFYGCESLTSITIPDSVTSIGEGAFFGCSKLESITLPFVGAVKDGRDAYFGYIFGTYNEEIPSSLKAVVITGGGNIESEAFCGCESLTSITIPNSVTSIGGYAFTYCSSLTSITIPDSVTSIGDYAFADCSNLTSVTIGNSVTSIGEAAFEGCFAVIEWGSNTTITNIDGVFNGYLGTSITIPNSVTSIGEEAFKSFYNLTSVTIGSGVISIGDRAFTYCESLTSIAIPNSVTSIGEEAFYGCESLTSITIPDSVTSIGEGAFYGCSSSIYQEYGNCLYLNNWLITAKNNEVTIVTLKNTTVRIYRQAFSDCYDLTSITIPDSVISIGNGAFESCSNLTSVTIGNNVKSIGDGAFALCSSVSSIVIPNSVMHIGNSVFEGCYNLTSVTIGNSVTSIGDYAFAGCSNLTSVTMGSGIISIGNSAFAYCENLTSIAIPNSVTSIGDSAFSGCAEITSITVATNNQYYKSINGNFYTKDGKTLIQYAAGKTETSFTVPESVMNIGKEAFGSCSNLTSITIPDNVISIGSSAFSGCSNLTSITIPDSVTSIGNYAFRNCIRLAEIIIDSNNPNYKSIEGNLYTIDGKTLIQYAIGKINTSFTIPLSVTSVENFAFSGCTRLNSVTIGNSVTNIGSSAFFRCSNLASVTIGNGVTSIGQSAFAYCTNLTSITIPDSVTTIGRNAFFGCSSSIYQESGNCLYLNNWLIKAKNTSVTSVTLKSTTVGIYISAFEGCSSLESITLPFVGNTKDGTENTHFGYIFGANSYSQNNFSIPSSLKTVIITGGNNIANMAFRNCSNLTSIIIGNSVTSIGEGAFSGCSSLTAITIPDNVTSIGQGAFAGCTNLVYQESGNCLYLNNWLIKAKNTSVTSVTLKSTTVGIYHEAFRNCKNLTSITIPDSVTSIGYGAFAGCTSLVYQESGNCLYLNNWLIKAKNTSVTSVTLKSTTVGIYHDAFAGCTNLTSITIPDNVISIGEEAFYGCKSLTSVTIGNGVQSIGKGAFSGCSSLTAITIPDNVTSIGQGAFAGCTNLTIYCQAASLPAGWNSSWNPNNLSVYWAGEWTPLRSFEFELTNDGRGYIVIAFVGDESEIIIPSSYNGKAVTNIGDYAFRNCTSLTSITIPNSVMSIGYGAFYGCQRLTSITIPDNVTNIGHDAFFGCSSLVYQKSGNCLYLNNWLIKAKNTSVTSVTLKSTTVGICHEAFRNCKNLTSITIPDSVKNIGESAFYDCNNLNYEEYGNCLYLNNWLIKVKNTSVTSVTLKSNTIGIAGGSFYGCSSLTSINVNSNNANYKSIDGNLYTKDVTTLIQYAIGKTAVSFVIPNSVTGIGDYAFYNCKNLASVTIGNNVKSIGDGAFVGCSSLTSITIPDSVISIENSAFTNCSSLTSITIGNNVKSIGDGAFALCSSVSSIVIPNSVMYIGNSAFENCIRLAEIIVDADNADYKSIDGNLYTKDGTTLIQYAIGKAAVSFIIPDSVTSIEDRAFQGCSKLNSITIGNGVQSIGGGAFSGCSSLTAITIPDNVTRIGQGAFAGCTNLVYQESGNCLYLNNWLIKAKNTSVTSVTLKSTTVGIYHEAFARCSNLISITIPDSVQSIESWAFSYCSNLASVTVPDSVTSIEDGAFYYCSNLTNATIGSGVTNIGYYAFSYCSNLISIIIPDSVTNIGEGAFRGCLSFTEITVDSNNANYKSIDGNLYTKDETTLIQYAIGKADSSFTVPDSVIYVGDSAFSGCSRLASITIPSNVISIGYEKFDGCYSLASINVDADNANYKSIDGNLYTKDGTTLIQYAIGKADTSFIIPDGVTGIGGRAFEGCSSLVSITISDSVTSIGSRAFFGIFGITNIIIPNNVISIEELAFANCSSLASVTVPDSVTSIGNGAFHGCSNLTSITIDENNQYYKSIDGNLYTKDGKTLIQYAIGKADSSFTIPDSVKSVGYEAFYYCKNLTFVTIGNGVTSIGVFAFEGCTNLTIYCKAVSKPAGWHSSWNPSNRPVVWGYTGE